MRILMVVTWYGEKKKDKFTGNFHTDMAKAMMPENETAIYFPFDCWIDENFSSDHEDGVLVFRSKNTIGHLKRYAQVKDDFKRICQSFRPDIIHAHVCTGAGEVALIINKISDIPFVVTEHMPIEMMSFSFKSKLKYRLITSSSCGNVAVSPNLRDRLNAIYKNSHYQYINNGVYDPERYLKDANTQPISGDWINCALVGAFYSKDIKGLQFLLPTMERLVREGEKIRLHVCGGGAYLDYFIKMAENLKLTDHVIFYGMCEKEKVYEIMSRMDFMISASLYESAGIVTEEACLLGKPQVITNSGGANSLIPDQYAVKVGKSSIDELYKGIKKMMSVYEIYDRHKIRDYGKRHFLMEQSCKQYIDLYNSVLGK